MRIGGISSGIDTHGLIQQLMSLERRPIQNLSNNQQISKLKKGLLQEINTSLATLQKSLQNLSKSDAFGKVATKSSNQDVASITADDNAVRGIYDLRISRLATATVFTTDKLNPATERKAAVVTGETLGTDINLNQTFEEVFGADIISKGSVHINGISFQVDPDETIQSFMNKVNGHSNVGVTISYSSDDQNFSIESKELGSNAKITLNDFQGTGLFAALKIDTSSTYKGSGTADLHAPLAEAGIGEFEGTITFSINGIGFTFDSEKDSLNTVLNKINGSNAGVMAFYDSESDKISFSNRVTGTNDINFLDGEGGFFAALGGTQTNGQTAQFSLNGVSMERDSNDFKVNGIQFNLIKEGNTVVTVEKDVNQIYNSIKEFVDNYNKTNDLLMTRLSEDKVPNATSDALRSRGLLKGDSTLIGLRTGLRSMLTSSVSGLDNKFTMLMEIGITTTSEDFGKSGRLVIDEIKLKEALDQDLEAVQKLFFHDVNDNDKIDEGDKGLVANLSKMIDTYISTSTNSIGGKSYKNGILQAQMESIDTMVSNFDQQIEDLERRMEKVEARYWRQFNAMEQVLNRLTNQSQWLTAQLATLPTLSNKS